MLSLAWRNIWRNVWRSLLTIGGVAFAAALLVFAVALESGTYDTMVQTALRVQAGHVQVQAPNYLDKKGLRDVVGRPDEVVRAIETIPDVAAVATRAAAVALLSSSDRTLGAYIVGVQPAKEARVSSIAAAAHEGRYLDETDTNHAVIGASLAKALHVAVGEELVVLGEGYDGSVASAVLTVKGLFRSGQPELDRNLVQIPLNAFQEIFAMGDAAHEVVVVGRDLERLPQLADTIGQVLPRDEALAVRPWYDLLPGLKEAIQLDRLSNWIFYSILIVVVALSLMNTFLMAVLERTREFGVMLVLGMTPRRLMRVVFAECALMALVGGAIGIVIGAAITAYFQVHGIEVPGAEMFSRWGLPSRLAPKLSWAAVLAGPALVVATTLSTAVFPVVKIGRLNVARAVRAS
jgi:ABC-type lipoprotein release transport system permease subunit